MKKYGGFCKEIRYNKYNRKLKDGRAITKFKRNDTNTLREKARQYDEKDRVF